MEYNDFILDFAKRTYENLLIIEKMVNNKDERDSKAYEVTALVNSFIGLLVFPQQSFLSQVPIRFPSDTIKKAFMKCSSTYPEDKNPTFKGMVRHLRNSVSHLRLSVHPIHSEMKEISAFKFEDIDSPSKKFEVVLSIQEMREVLVEMLRFVFSLKKVPFPY